MSRIKFLIAGCGLAALLLPAASMAETQRPNVLFLAIDDLNHWVGHLGVHSQTKTPQLDRLAKTGVSFNKAYCAASACNPSRIAWMSDLRPSTTGCYDNAHNWRPTVSEDKLLNKTLLDAGYQCFGTGKILHGSYGHSSKWTEFRKTTGGWGGAGMAGMKACPPPGRPPRVCAKSRK